MKEKKEEYARTLTLTATQLSLLHQGVKALIAEQKEAIASQQEPYKLTLKKHLTTLKELESLFAGINAEVEEQVITDIKKTNR